MARYAGELVKALRDELPANWELERISCEHVELIHKLVPGKAGVLAAERLGRFVKYPLYAAGVKADVFHVLDHGHANIALALDLNKTIITCHDLITVMAQLGELSFTAGSFHNLTNPLRIKALKNARHLICISESTKKDLMRLLGIPEDRISVIYLGCSQTFTAPTEAERVAAKNELCESLKIPTDSKLVLNVSTGTAYKNSPAVIRTIAGVRKALEQPVFLLRVNAGFTPEEQKLVQQLDVSDAIIFTGRAASDLELRKMYWAADVLLFPSLYEGFGWPPLESLACGTPVVCSNAASLPEAVGKGGLLAEPTNYDALIKHVLAVLTNAELHENLSKNGLAHAAQFTWKRTALKTLAIYEAVAAARCINSAH